jgi:adhesin transport system membrane fusion protein
MKSFLNYLRGLLGSLKSKANLIFAKIPLGWPSLSPSGKFQLFLKYVQGLWAELKSGALVVFKVLANYLAPYWMASKKRSFKENAKHVGQKVVDYYKIEQTEYQSDGLRDFVTDADFQILNQQPIRGMLIIRIALSTVVLFFLWAALTHVDELVKGDAKVVTSSQLQVMQSLDGGVVKSINVKEGDAVKAGQALLEIDPIRFDSSLNENKAQDVALAAKAERLNAFIEGRSFHYPEKISASEKAVYDQESLYLSTVRSDMQNQVLIARQELSQKNQELVELKAKRDQSEMLKDSANHELTLTRPLLSSGAVSEVDLLRLQRDVTRYDGERAQAVAQIAKVNEGIIEAGRKIQQVELEAKNNARKDLSDTMARLNSVSATSAGLKDKVAQSVIRAPMNGYVKRLLVNTVGGVVSPGKDIIEVVPSNDTLLLESKVQPRDIAFLRVGQKALVKFSAYDFSIYGGMDATLESIGADSITDDKGNTYYIVRVRTNEPKFNKKYTIIPGMQAEVDIHTGSKTVLTYLLKPILRAKQVGLTER